VPVIISGAALAAGWTRQARTARIVAAGVLFAVILLSLFSIGMFYIPSLIALALSAVFTPGIPPSRNQDTNLEQPV
jgi:hypothetical protein